MVKTSLSTDWFCWGKSSPETIDSIDFPMKIMGLKPANFPVKTNPLTMIIHEMSGILLERDRENGLDMNRLFQTQLDI